MSTCTYTQSSPARGRKRSHRLSMVASTSSDASPRPIPNPATEPTLLQQRLIDAPSQPETGQGTAPSNSMPTTSFPSPPASRATATGESLFNWSELSWDPFSVGENTVLSSDILDVTQSPSSPGPALSSPDWRRSPTAHKGMNTHRTSDSAGPDPWNLGDMQHEPTPAGKQSPPVPTTMPSSLTFVSASPATAASKKYSYGCQCLGTMTHLLEVIGGRGPTAGVDMLLGCLGRSVGICEEVLACNNCNACADNGMLLAANAQ